jgi:predicted Fe-Mo cluster-binding NifX family protein
MKRKEKKMRVAVPAENPGGLKAPRSGHFGHCDLFTVIDLDEKGKIVNVESVENGRHEAGGCMVPVKLLKDAGVESIIVGGMGARPMQGFTDAGIGVYFADRNSFLNVEDVLKQFVENKLPVMHATQVCKGSGNCHH